MCNSSFKESIDGFIKLPEVEVTVFEDFMLWLHSYIPSQTIQKDFPAVLDLAIFAEMYQILPLQNQTSDIILQMLNDNQSLVTPEILSRVYESTPDGSVLRRHFCLAFCTLHDSPTQYPYSITSAITSDITSETLSEWEAVFDAFPNFGRDYFRNTRSPPESTFQNRDFCSFHDHSNMVGWVRGDKKTPCPYQEGDWFENEVIMDKMREEKMAREEERQKRKGKRAARIAKRERATNKLLLAAAAAAEDLVEETDNHIPAEDAPAEYFREEDEA